MKIVDISNAEHYLWGGSSDGWHLAKQDEMSVISERVPAGECEQRHFHARSRQFFYILMGEAVIEVDGEHISLQPHQGIEIPPGTAHQFRNESNSDVSFLVVSVPKSHGDRFLA